MKVEKLLWRFDASAEPALGIASLQIEKGEFVLVVGASGSGKSTLANCIKGIVPHLIGGAFEGSVEVDGVNTLEQPVSHLSTKVGMVFQDPETQLCNLFIKDEIAFGPENLRVAPDLVRSRVREALAFVGLSEDAVQQRFVYEVSGGQKQRIAIASVLAMQPPILVFDEPTANLDPQGGADVIEAIKRLHASGHTVLVIEHRLDDLIDVADRMIVIQDGSIILDGPPRELLASASGTLRDRCGVRIPQVCALALQLGDDFRWDPFPLGIGELVAQTEQSFSGVSAGTSPEPPSTPAPARADEIANLERVSFQYPDGTRALRDISLQLFRGQTVAIGGTNGSGKTTLARMLVGLLRPSEGRVTVLGRDVSSLSANDVVRQVGYVFQYPEHQFIKDRVFDEVAYGLEVQGYDPDTVRRRTEHVLGLFGLDRYRDRHPLQLSGGEKRRLSVATMLVLEPALLILDEPTFGQDADSSRRMMEHLLGQVAGQTDLTPIIITHDMELVASYCDRLIVMSSGAIVGDGPPRELFRQSEVLHAGSLVRPPVSEYVLRLRERGADIPATISQVDEFVDWYYRSHELDPALA